MASPQNHEETTKNKWEKTIPEEEKQAKSAPLTDEEDAQLPVEDDEAEQGKPNYEELALLYEEAKAKSEEHWEQFVRSEAEFKNFQRRVEKRIGDTHKFAIEKVLHELLPVMDSLEQGLDQSPENITESIQSMREGIELTLKMLLDTLGKFGVTQLNPLNETYDPHFHEALSMAPTEGVKSGCVVTVVQKGYVLHGRVVRPARVIVAK